MMTLRTKGYFLAAKAFNGDYGWPGRIAVAPFRSGFKPLGTSRWWELEKVRVPVVATLDGESGGYVHMSAPRRFADLFPARFLLISPALADPISSSLSERRAAIGLTELLMFRWANDPDSKILSHRNTPLNFAYVGENIVKHFGRPGRDGQFPRSVSFYVDLQHAFLTSQATVGLVWRGLDRSGKYEERRFSITPSELRLR